LLKLTTMKKINIKIVLAFAILVGVTNSCKEQFLEITPNGALDATVLTTKAGVDNLLIGAYSMLDGVSSAGFGWEAASSNWVYGSIRGLEANKGTDSGDQPDINPIQTFSESPTNPYLNVKWRSVYDGISRANAALVLLARAEKAGTVTAAEADSFRKQARALRGFFHLEAYRMWAKADGTGIPYIDELSDPAKLDNTVDVRDPIVADLDAGTTLPIDMVQVGRFNGTVAKVLKAKALMQMKKDYAGAKALLVDVIANGKAPDGSAIGLEPKYGDIFDAERRNGIESIYTVQYSVNDGSGGWNGGWGEVLNFPYKSGASPGGCCGFFQPSQEFVNSFRTIAGLPMLDGSYNVNPDIRDDGKVGGGIWDVAVSYAKNAGVTVYNPLEPFKDLGYQSLVDNNKGNNPLTSPASWTLIWTEDNSRAIDPRLDWSAGRRGIPYLDWGVHTGGDWIRDQSYAGPYAPKKQVYRKSQEGSLTEVGNWTSGWTANGYRMIRYADVLLLLAECQIETNDLPGALINVNLVRTRAANPAGFVKESDIATNAANYNIVPYPSFPDQDYARKALRMERKLELGMEGHRYFDLQRWGNLQSELAAVLAYEKTRRPALYGAAAVGSEDVNFPIPQTQIDITQGKLKQNR
jgi:starch-binding outer membrane protein, SusD/RagB family